MRSDSAEVVPKVQHEPPTQHHSVIQSHDALIIILRRGEQGQQTVLRNVLVEGGRGVVGAVDAAGIVGDGDVLGPAIP